MPAWGLKRKMAKRILQVAALPALLLALELATKDGESRLRLDPIVCSASTFAGGAPGAPEAGGKAYWPHLHGPSQDGSSAHVGPFDVNSSLAWKWQNPQGRFYSVLNGVVIDGGKNLYLSGDDFVRKFTPDGVNLWTYCTTEVPIPSAPTLVDGLVIATTERGSVIALDMTTGHEVWRRKVGRHIGCDTHAVASYRGVLVVPEGPVDTPCCGRAGGRKLHALRATDGAHLWEFETDRGVWNFHALFPGDGSIVYQDLEGKLYRNNLTDGTLLWKRGGMAGTWNDGSASMGPGNLVYSVTSLGPNVIGTPGEIGAYRLDGTLAWSLRVSEPPNQFPAVGTLIEGQSPSLVGLIGLYEPSWVIAHDAATGAERWRFPGPPQHPVMGSAAGDPEGFATRVALGAVRQRCLPNSWSNPSVDAAGTIYAGHNGGRFLAYRDANGDGRIDPNTEVSFYDGGTGFPGGGPAIAPGMVAVASCDSLLVFKSDAAGKT